MKNFTFFKYEFKFFKGNGMGYICERHHPCENKRSGTSFTGYNATNCNKESPCEKKKMISRSTTFGIKTDFYDDVAGNLPNVTRVPCPSIEERKFL